jgi:hypothetical protein
MKVQDFTDTTRFLMVYVHRISEMLVFSVPRVAKERGPILLICDKSFTTQNLAFFGLLVQKETFADALLTGIVS